MTGDTGGFKLSGVDRPGVTLAAGHGRVATIQGKRGQLIVIKARLLPVLRVMTSVTTITVITFVRVILLVTTYACRRNVAVLVRLGMAGFATCSSVLIEQGKSGSGMVETFHPPVLVCGMTRLAIGAQRALVLVVRLVTSNAGRGRVLVVRRLWMTSLAFGVDVFAIQLKAGGCVIKPGFRPLAFSMAITALVAERSLMLVISLVAGKAKCGQLDLCRRRHMATLALRGAMFSSQSVPGIRVMVEV